MEPARPFLGADEATCRTGDLEVRLAQAHEVDEALALRFRVFCEERGARSSKAASGLEEDAFDRDCDHLIVIDHACAGRPVVGTYRLLREETALRIGGFYSAGEYDLAPLIAQGRAHAGAPQLLELGRSCVDPRYRTNATITLLWRAIAFYLERHRVGFMFGCASFPGTDPALFRDELAYLHRFHLAPPPIRVRAWAKHHVEMARAVDKVDMSGRGLPPLIKAYLRVGAQVGDGAFIDHDFNTVDVFMVMPVERIVGRYGRKFGLVT
ncbi:GNAT family N-acetyltransferase [Novosphingobium sp. FGD1]|jgi:L-ornithine Nalpha-acyltransferase|uniref:L-ornithine N(alpha)-acyltransferase n=1 Tax=Novosphingobium silvae TaxID=2692619 RepID=A0A7X4GJV8_9SPHN|nr:GNAT family N-acyltransferase [Novosphingobium silvae]MYL99948.1 GNAT family N-acetyltransferase [Novosphingobium silvae]